MRSPAWIERFGSNRASNRYRIKLRKRYIGEKVLGMKEVKNAEQLISDLGAIGDMCSIKVFKWLINISLMNGLIVIV